jgi:hypothetical protein
LLSGATLISVRSGEAYTLVAEVKFFTLLLSAADNSSSNQIAPMRNDYGALPLVESNLVVEQNPVARPPELMSAGRV